MSRPIKITDEMAVGLRQDFLMEFAKIITGKHFDGTVKFEKKITWTQTGKKASVTMTLEAFAKMQMLIQQFKSEVAWHGVAYRSEEDPTSFIITDILVYPQVVTGATVNTDQEAYQTWLYQFDNETFNNIRMQGHSHVDFSTNPSDTDLQHQEKILAQMDDDMFYIFMIWNKRLERTIRIFDMANNTLYENGDITVKIGSDGIDLVAFMKQAETLVKTKYQYGGNQYAGNTGAGAAKTGSNVVPYNAPGTTQKPQTTPSGAVNNSQNSPAMTPPAVQQNNTTPASVPTTATGELKTKPKNKPAIGSGWGGVHNQSQR